MVTQIVAYMCAGVAAADGSWTEFQPGDSSTPAKVATGGKTGRLSKLLTSSLPNSHINTPLIYLAT